MKIALLTSLPDPSRLSMVMFDSMLKAALEKEFPREADVVLFSGGSIPHGRLKISKLKRYWEQYFLYPWQLKKIQADIFHITDHGYGHLLPSLNAEKSVATFHDALLPALDEGRLPVKHRPKTAIFAQRYALKCLKKARFILTVSNFSRQEFLRYNPECAEKTIVVHEGVNENFFNSVSQEEKAGFCEKWKLPKNKRAILMIGRTDPHKNTEGGLHAFSQLNEHYKADAILIKAGSPFTADQRDLIRRLGIESRVYFLGALPFREIPIVYQISSALLFLSFYEGFGFPALEAMASGVPAVLSGCGALKEIAGESALIVGPQDPSLAAENLYRTLEDVPFRNGLIAKGKKQAASFTWQETAKKTMAIYRKVLS